MPGGRCGRAHRSLLSDASSSRQKAIAQQRHEHHKAVPPGDLLALVELASGVGNRYLVDTVAHAQDARSDLRIESRPWLAQLQWPRDVEGEWLVAGLHVGERRIEQHIAQQGQRLVAHAVPEIHRLVLAQEARAV